MVFTYLSILSLARDVLVLLGCVFFPASEQHFYEKCYSDQKTTRDFINFHSEFTDFLNVIFRDICTYLHISCIRLFFVQPFKKCSSYASNELYAL